MNKRRSPLADEDKKSLFIMRFLTLYRPRPLLLVCAESKDNSNYFSFSKAVALEDLANMHGGRGIVAKCSSDEALDTWASPSIMPRRHRGDRIKKKFFVIFHDKDFIFFLIKKK